MGDRRLESVIKPDNRFFFYDYPTQGFSLQFASGPEMTKHIKPGSWLDTWEIVDGKRRFAFSLQKHLAFASKEAAEDAQAELKRAVDIITEIAEA